MSILAPEMEENQESQAETQVKEEPQAPSNPGVSFPTIPSTPKSGSNVGKVILIVSILAIVGVLGFFIFKGSQSSSQASPTPESLIEGSETPVPTATPNIDKTKIKIEVQNGTGISGEAAYLQGVLKSLGYSDINIANSTSQDNVSSVVTFSNNSPQMVVGEITAKLESIYQSVTTKTSGTQSADVLIVTGLRKGATPKPSATATPKPSASPTATPTPTATP